MTLPNDVARCAGVGDDEEGWRDGCEDCARRLAESTSAVSAWMLPPAIIAFWCEFRIAPSNAELRGAKPIGEASLSNDVLERTANKEEA